MKKITLLEIKPFMKFKNNSVCVENVIYHVAISTGDLIDISFDLAEALLTKNIKDIKTDEIDLNILEKHLETNKLFVSCNVYFKLKGSSELDYKHFDAFKFFYT